ncbi:efflux RND transporter permease subunit [Acetomicrobium sp. UBA5826]|uniref:efflux RND transporter permease subunit n=1 Tax=Acetomicrobium sp. UBA5826 TaxID=1946039 RepID=UPI00257AD0EF|nr:efflux RND transporter permease subunit [Acetomicrobium sp. UBA5826]
MNLWEIAVKRPTATLMFFIAVILLGVVSFIGIRVDLLPQFEQPVILAITTWEGAAASDVEQEITEEVEDRMATIQGLDEITSTSSDGASAVVLRFEWGEDLDARMGDARDQVNIIRRRLPDDADDPILTKTTSSALPVMLVIFKAGPTFPGLYHFVDNDVSKLIQQVPGVGDVSIFGGDQREIKILLDAEKLKAYNLSAQQIASVLQQEHFNLPAGSFKEGMLEYQVRVPGRYKLVNEIGYAIVGTTDGKPVYLKDVATVEDGYKDASTFGWADAARSVVMMITKNTDANTVQVSNGVKARLEELKGSIFPSDVDYVIGYDQSEFILNSLKQLATTLLYGVVLVFLVTYVFLRRLPGTLAVCGAIPFSLIATFIAMRILGYTVNLMTLSALTVACGMVVDNAIVTTDQVVYHIEMGEKRQIASMLGAGEVGSALIASTLTTLAVLLPLVFITGLVGIFFSSLSVVMSLAIVSSLVVSLSFIPMVGSKTFKSQEDKLFIHRHSKRILTLLERYYALLIDWALRNRKKIIGLALICAVFTVVGFTRVGTELIPRSDTGSVRVNFRLPEGTRVEETEKVAKDVMAYAMDNIPELENVYIYGGSAGDDMSALRGESSNIGTIGIELVSKGERKRSGFQVAAQVRQYLNAMAGFEAVSANVSSPIMAGGSSKPIVIELYGDDVNELLKIGDEIRKRVEGIPGAVDIEITQKASRPEIWVDVDKERASLLGVPTSNVAQALRAYYYGVQLDEDYWEGEDNYEVWLRLQPDQRHSWDTLNKLLVPSVTGDMIRLTNLATIKEELGPPELHRKDRQRYITIELDAEGRSVGNVATDIEKALKEIELPAGMRTEITGDVEDMKETFLQMGLLILFGVVLVYMIMAGQYEAFLDPFIIMFSVPFALTGVVGALLLTGLYLSLQGLLGIVMLVGTVVNNAIVLVDYVNLLRARGYVMHDALVEGGSRRLRPILMTTLTTVLGMLPMALSQGEGAEIWRPLAVSVIGGLSFSTLVTLVLIPVVYSLVEEKIRRRPRFVEAKGGTSR